MGVEVQDIDRAMTRGDRREDRRSDAVIAAEKQRRLAGGERCGHRCRDQCVVCGGFRKFEVARVAQIDVAADFQSGFGRTVAMVRPEL